MKVGRLRGVEFEANFQQRVRDSELCFVELGGCEESWRVRNCEDSSSD
jgi:hypothetical protein